MEGDCGLEGLRRTKEDFRIAGLRPRFEPGTSVIGNRDANHSTATFVSSLD
jgi:hypothetical protein